MKLARYNLLIVESGNQAASILGVTAMLTLEVIDLILSLSLFLTIPIWLCDLTEGQTFLDEKDY